MVQSWPPDEGARRLEGLLVLEDGAFFTGRPFGAVGRTTGELVANTGMTGYQEVLTDPSYAGQIVVMTYPLIGNYGVSGLASESSGPKVRGLVVHQLSQLASHWRSEETLSQYLFRHGVMALEGADTRAIARHLRQQGPLRAVMATAPAGLPTDLLVTDLARRAAQVRLPRPVLEVSTPRPYRVYGSGPRVALLDYGVKQNIIRNLTARDCDVTVLPALSSAAEVLALRPDGIVLSNGPGDPAELPEAVETARAILASGIPTFGICLGQQILALAAGARTFKMPFGHRGLNHPVRDEATGRIAITSQNHGYAVVEDSLPESLVVTHRNVNDGTVEGLRHHHLPVFAVQYHPEAGPGPDDAQHLFDQFLALMRRAAS